MLPALPELSRLCENASRKLPRLVDAELGTLPSELVSVWKLCCSESRAERSVVAPVAVVPGVEVAVAVPEFEDSCWIRLCRFDSICDEPPPRPPSR